MSIIRSGGKSQSAMSPGLVPVMPEEREPSGAPYAMPYADLPQWYMYPPKPAYIAETSDYEIRQALRRHTGETNLYIHIPFCSMKCTFCSLFASAGSSDAAIGQYVTSIVREIGLISELLDPGALRLRNVYFGGGTPSLMDEFGVTRIFEAIESAFTLGATTSVTVEFSPDTVSRSGAKHWLSRGATHVSLGVQSFDDGILSAMHRKHSGDDAMRSIEALRSAGFSYVNIDLIYGNGRQDEMQWGRDIERAVQSLATRVAIYPLAVKGKPALNAKIKRGQFSLSSNSQYRALHAIALNKFRNAGWTPTGALSFSDNGIGNPLEEDEANGVPTIGIGAGSRTYLRSLHTSSIPTMDRATFGAELAHYYRAIERRKLPVAAIAKLDDEEQFRRYLVLGIVGPGFNLRLLEALEQNDLKETVRVELQQLTERELVETKGDLITLTDEGVLRAAEVGLHLSSRNVRRLVS